MAGNLELKSTIITFSPTIVPAAYSSGDQIGALAVELPNASDETSGTVQLLSLVVVDKSDSGASLDVLFFDSNPTLTSGDNDALSITDAEVAARYLGTVSLLTADYQDIGGSKVQTKAAIGLMLKPAAGSGGGQASRSLYAVVQARGAVTFGSASDLVFKAGLLQD